MVTGQCSSSKIVSSIASHVLQSTFIVTYSKQCWKDVIYQQSRLPSINSTVVRALNTLGIETPSRRNSSSPNSQPSSPLKKDGFVFSPEEIQSHALSRRMDRMFVERHQVELGQIIKINVD